MPSNARSSARTVHVHGAEVSTDQSQLWDYAEALAMLVAVLAVLAAVWIAAEPSPNADFTQPASIAAPTGDFERVPDSTRDVYQPDPDGPSEVAVVRRGAAIGAPLGPDDTPTPATPTA
ncbi:MAG: hypothetical protein JWL76_2424 [Thermoleophilia bacterium]|nr:hypothetical protein [Thermoleophilia bacterium]